MKKGSLNKWVAVTIVLTTVLCPVANPVFASSSDSNQIAQPILTVKSNFSDLGQATESMQDAILLAQQRGLMTGDTSGQFHPQSTLTRQEFCIWQYKSAGNGGGNLQVTAARETP